MKLKDLLNEIKGKHVLGKSVIEPEEVKGKWAIRNVDKDDPPKYKKFIVYKRNNFNPDDPLKQLTRPTTFKKAEEFIKRYKKLKLHTLDKLIIKKVGEKEGEREEEVFIVVKEYKGNKEKQLTDPTTFKRAAHFLKQQETKLKGQDYDALVIKRIGMPPAE